MTHAGWPSRVESKPQARFNAARESGFRASVIGDAQPTSPQPLDCSREATVVRAQQQQAIFNEEGGVP